MHNDILLNFYRKYDYLNAEDNPLVKILVGYIKPSFLFKSKILTPIHLGREVEKEFSKDGIVSDSDINWLHNNCIGDNSDDNISNQNRRIGFLTGTYWAWKNYEKLGNPLYFGSFGYQKLLEPSFLEDIKKFDIVLPEESKLLLENNKIQFIAWHSENLYESMIRIFSNIYPDEVENFEGYLNLSWGYYHEIYVMKKNIFFDFCNWIFPLLFSAVNDKNCRFIEDNPQKISMQKISGQTNDVRDIAFIMEIYTGYYLYRLILETNLKSKKIKIIHMNQNERAKSLRINLLKNMRDKVMEDVKK